MAVAAVAVAAAEAIVGPRRTALPDAFQPHVDALRPKVAVAPLEARTTWARKPRFFGWQKIGIDVQVDGVAGPHGAAPIKEVVADSGGQARC